MLGHHGDHVAEPAVARAGAQFGDARMKAPGEADGEHQSGLARGRGDGKRAVKIERQRLLDKDVLVRRYRRQRLRLVLTVRRGEHHGVDIGSAQYFIVAVDQDDPLGRGRIPRRWRACACAVARTNRMSSLFPATALTSERPHRPSPTIAARIMAGGNDNYVS